MQSLLRMAFPPQCISCGDLVEQDFGLCGACWRDTPFATGLVCDLCGVPLPGEDHDKPEYCDDCLRLARPWEHGRAVLMYRDNARRLVLAFKHGDRLDLARPAAQWMAAAADALLLKDSVIVPIPAHYLRFVGRRYNQAAVLAQALGQLRDHQVIPDLLRRCRRTPIQDGMSRDDRFRNLSGAIVPARSAAKRLAGRSVLLIDDVMTSGATFAAATDACHAAGASHVCVLALARVAKDD